ncbi:MAG TPA: RNA 2',3'-cyclic phosphodiesterase [Phycisphaerae bacterium]|nr:RNA 2',3'-cyclic phosphodiesterase [Phycisphaerae bacterium]HNU46916.1 RNA 2',3'-cyclic phosphodiesterase [Phycisphaerae bacterium]
MRLFVAILLDEPVRLGLKRVQEHLTPGCSGVRWVRWDQLHVTLKFLGEVRDGDVPKVCSAVTEAAATLPAFDMTLRGTGCFPPRGLVRIVWAGIDEPTGTVVRLAEAVENRLADLGFPREQRPFSPHITIGRVKEDHSNGGIRRAVGAGSFAALPQAVERIAVMASVLAREGPTYSIVSRANLSGGRG